MSKIQNIDVAIKELDEAIEALSKCSVQTEYTKKVYNELKWDEIPKVPSKEQEDFIGNKIFFKFTPKCIACTRIINFIPINSKDRKYCPYCSCYLPYSYYKEAVI